MMSMNFSCLKFTDGGSNGKSNGRVGLNGIVVRFKLYIRYVTNIQKVLHIANDMVRRVTYQKEVEVFDDPSR